MNFLTRLLKAHDSWNRSLQLLLYVNNENWRYINTTSLIFASSFISFGVWFHFYALSSWKQFARWQEGWACMCKRSLIKKKRNPTSAYFSVDRCFNLTHEQILRLFIFSCGISFCLWFNWFGIGSVLQEDLCSCEEVVETLRVGSLLHTVESLLYAAGTILPLAKPADNSDNAVSTVVCLAGFFLTVLLLYLFPPPN